MSRRAARSRARENASTSSPRNRTAPDVGSISRSMQRPVVVLPLPDSPTSPNVSPSLDREAHVVDGRDDACRARNRPAAAREVLDEMRDLDERHHRGRGVRVVAGVLVPRAGSCR